MHLRDYQTATVEHIVATRAALLVVAPTGAGKGTIAVAVTAHMIGRGLSVVIVVHRKELIRDLVKRFKRAGIEAGEDIIHPAKVRIVTVQSVLNATMGLRSIDYLILDEAHHYAAVTWRAVKTKLKPGRVLGFTATPQRADGRSLGDMFARIWDCISYSELLARGLIVPARVVRPRAALGESELAMDPVQAYLRYGRGERALLYMRRIDEADDVAKRLREAGIDADVVHSKMRYARVLAAMDALEKGTVQAVVNVGMLTEGVDVPHVTCIVLARQCKHASSYVQICGRVLRAHPDKEEGTLIDLTGASHKHGMPAVDRAYSLSGAGIEPRKRENLRTEHEPKSVETLDLDLEIISAAHSQDPVFTPAPRTRGRSKKPPAPIVPGPGRVLVPDSERKSKTAPKTKQLPLPRSPGFIYKDREFYQLRWREYGAKQQIGLCTSDATIAEEMLQLFRAEGAAAVQARVLMRRRTGCSSYFDSQHQMYLLTRWDGARIRREKKRLYTTDKAIADQMVALAMAGDARALENLIDRERTKRGTPRHAKWSEKKKEKRRLAAQEAAQ